MGLIHILVSFLYILVNLLALLLTLPPYFIYKFVSSILAFFSIEDVTGKVVLITGASSGIGEQLAYEYAKRRAKLVLVARREVLLRKVAEKARKLGSPDVITTLADVSNIDHCKRFIEEAINHFGHLDHLVNNAGITSVCFFEESSDIAKLAPIMDVNFWGSVYTTYFAIPHLKKSRGRIIVNTSVAGWSPSPTISIYGASKAALISFYETLRIELGPSIRISIVCPGFTDSEMTRGKHISKEGVMEVDEAKIQDLIGKLPIQDTTDAAKVIVNGVCRGEKRMTIPSWIKMVFLWQLFFPDLYEWCGRFLYVSSYTKSEKISSHTERKKLT